MLVCIVLSALANVGGSIFLRVLIDDYITPMLGQASPVFSGLLKALSMMACVYVVGILSMFLYNRLMVSISQGVLKTIRDQMFAHMQTLPIRYYIGRAHV